MTEIGTFCTIYIISKDEGGEEQVKRIFNIVSLLFVVCFSAVFLTACTPSATITPSAVVSGTTLITDLSSDTAKEKWFGGAAISLYISVINTESPFSGGFTYRVTSKVWEDGAQRSVEQSLSGNWSETTTTLTFGGITYKLASLTDAEGNALSLTTNNNANYMWFYSNPNDKLQIRVLIGNANFKLYMEGTMSS